MKAELLYLGFEMAIDRAKYLGKFSDYTDAIEVAASYVALDDSLLGHPFHAGYIGVDTRRVLIWPGHVGWVCVHEAQEGLLEVALHEDYASALLKVGSPERDHNRFLMNVMAAGLPYVNVIAVLDGSKTDPTLLETELFPMMTELRPVFEIIEEQLVRSSVGDPALRRRVEEELQGAVATFYNQQPFEIQMRIWNGLSELIEQDRRFNVLTRLQEYHDLKLAAKTPEEIREALAWVIDYAYSNGVIVPMWDAITATQGAEYIPIPDASIKTIGILSQLGKLTRDDPEFATKVVGIMATLPEDNRFDRFMEDHPGVSLWQNMYSRVQRLQGDDIANVRLSWPLYQLLLQYALSHGYVK